MYMRMSHVVRLQLCWVQDAVSVAELAGALPIGIHELVTHSGTKYFWGDNILLFATNNVQGYLLRGHATL